MNILYYKINELVFLNNQFKLSCLFRCNQLALCPLLLHAFLPLLADGAEALAFWPHGQLSASVSSPSKCPRVLASSDFQSVRIYNKYII